MNVSSSMPQIAPHALPLVAHPDTPTDVVRALEVHVRRSAEGTLAVTYVIVGDLGRVRVPQPRAKAVAERLWQHTCCEMFVKRTAFAGYHELNFAPSGQWAAYSFQGYREGAELMDASLDPQIAVTNTPARLELETIVRLDRLSDSHRRDALALSLTAVIEESDGRLSYWALAHPAGKPDFHHLTAFALHLDEFRD
jgi:hypothetical protein